MCYVCRFPNTKGKRKKEDEKSNEPDSVTDRTTKKEEKKKHCVRVHRMAEQSQAKPNRAEKNASKYCMYAQRLSEKATKPDLPPLTASLFPHGEGPRSH